ncbi:hypothetical protein BC830DRAFT_285437 [Chytriomyces sp. MP71]|nr:hypothetical protein BC830DRAFT_285437 [Chytriomyces sp. MP71]
MTHIEFFIDDIPVEQYQQPLDAHAPVATKRQQQPIPATHHVIASNQVCPSASEKRAHQGDRLPTLRRTFSYKRLSLIQQERPRSPSPPSPELATLPSPPSLELGSSDDYGTLVDSDVEAEDALFLVRIHGQPTVLISQDILFLFISRMIFLHMFLSRIIPLKALKWIWRCPSSRCHLKLKLPATLLANSWTSSHQKS